MLVRWITGARRAFEPAIRVILHLYWRLTRGLTLGVRGLVIDGAGQVFLVKHTYVDGWHLPGGGVEPGETLLTALARELREEGNIEITADPPLHGIFFNGRISRRDHVAVYVVRAFRQASWPVPNHEIIGHARAHRRGHPRGAYRRSLVGHENLASFGQIGPYFDLFYILFMHYCVGEPPRRCLRRLWRQRLPGVSTPRLKSLRSMARNRGSGS
jgi:8-oxo-dGTP pyrophosphatase MutT (NUDIX family)